MSTGSVSAIQRQVSAALTAPVDEARRFVCQQKAQYVDETGWREAGQMKWLWVNATKDVTAFHLLDGRSADDARQVINQSAKGVVATDRYCSYNWLAARRRQLCWAHLQRDFQAMVERGGESEEDGAGALKQVKRLFTLWHKVRDGDLGRAQLQTAIKPVRRKVKELLEAGDELGTRRPGTPAPTSSRWSAACGPSCAPQGWNRRTTRPSGRCVEPCCGGRKRSGRRGRGQSVRRANPDGGRHAQAAGP